MKYLSIIAITALLILGGCSGSTPVNELDLDDFSGNWFMTGTMVLNIDGRIYTEDFGHTIYIRPHGFIEDEIGHPYNGTFDSQRLTLTRGWTFNGRDVYCGAYDGGTTVTFKFPAINPFFIQVYHGKIEAETAVYTQFCNYKPAVISGDVLFYKMN